MYSAESLGIFIETVAGLTGDERRILWFRGHRSRDWHVQPSIWRDYDCTGERNFTNRFCARAGTRHRAVPRYEDVASWLSLMQHYRLPTRLLDWSRSPLMALYFALEDYIYKSDTVSEDAVIWVLDPHALNENQLGADITPSLEATMCHKMVAAAFTDKYKVEPCVLAVMASENDVRMLAQQACFTLHSYEGVLESHATYKTFLTPVYIPAGAVRGMARALDICGFRKGDVFPDLDHLADELKGLWPPRKSAAKLCACPTR
jgi:hypothetical protein